MVGAGQGPMVLVVDDSAAQRRVLSVHLRQWGYRVAEAATGEEALKLCAAKQIDMVISDWMMPGMSGLELCRAFREMERSSYGYFLLLTARSGKSEIAEGLDFGADDFVTKPVAPAELRARLRAGERILAMAAELSHKNTVIEASLNKITTLYNALDRDLGEARQLQQSLVRDRLRDYGCAKLSLFLQSSGQVGGDLVGAYPVGSDGVGLFAFDVSGHGVASALMTARLAAYFSGTSPEQNLGLATGNGQASARAPHDVAAALNRLLCADASTDIYVTALLGDLDLATGQVRYVQCGYPGPVLLTQNHAAQIGDGGLPLGLLDEANWEEANLVLSRGDRMIWASDGWGECPDPKGDLLGDEGFLDLLQRNPSVAGSDIPETLLAALSTHAGQTEFPDDVSMLVVDYIGLEDVPQKFPVRGAVEQIDDGL